MNWDKIKEKHPKAYSKLIDFNEQRLEKEFNKTQLCNCGLFTFFDEQEIFIDVRPIYYDGLTFHVSLMSIKYDLTTHWQDKADTRIKAEEKALEKAFEILEDKL